MILQGEKIAADMRPFQPSRGNLIIFEHEGQLLVKRVIGVSGDTVEGRNLQVFTNGKLLDEPYVEHIGKRPLGVKSLETFGLLQFRQVSCLSRAITAIIPLTVAIRASG